MERKRKVMVLSAAILCGLVFWSTPTEAALITIEIEAVVDSVSDEGNYLEGRVGVGDIITGWYTYESTTPETNPSPNVGDYEHFVSPYGIFLSVGGFDFQTDPANMNFLVEIIDDSISGGLHDSYIVRSYGNLPLSNGASVDHISWILTDSSASALSSDALPTTAPILDEWQSVFGLRLHGERAGYIIDATVTRAIPEPVTVLLLGFGGLFLMKQR